MGGKEDSDQSHGPPFQQDQRQEGKLRQQAAEFGVQFRANRQGLLQTMQAKEMEHQAGSARAQGPQEQADPCPILFPGGLRSRFWRRFWRRFRRLRSLPEERTFDELLAGRFRHPAGQEFGLADHPGQEAGFSFQVP